MTTFVFLNQPHAAPQVDIFPAVATILPGQENIRLRCQASNSELPVLWVADNLVTELGSSSEYTVEIPTENSFPDLTAFTCIVRDPEINDPSPNNIVGRAVAYVRNIMGKSLTLSSAICIATADTNCYS